MLFKTRNDIIKYFSWITPADLFSNQKAKVLANYPIIKSKYIIVYRIASWSEDQIFPGDQVSISKKQLLDSLELHQKIISKRVKISELLMFSSILKSLYDYHYIPESIINQIFMNSPSIQNKIKLVKRFLKQLNVSQEEIENVSYLTLEHNINYLQQEFLKRQNDINLPLAVRDKYFDKLKLLLKKYKM